MTKGEWESYREHLKLKEGDWVRVTYRWSYGTTAAKRVRTLEGELEFIGDRGIDIREKRISYKVIECIDDPSDDYGDGFVWLRDGDGHMYSTIM